MPSTSPDVHPVLAAVTREEIRALTRTSDLAGALAIAWCWATTAGCLVAVALWPHPAVFVAAVVLLGGRQLALAVLMHDAAHGVLFRSRWLNDRLADWLCARPVWSDTARYRKHHLRHHAHTGTERDPDLGLALAKPMTRASLRRKILRDLVGASGLRRIVGLLAIDAELLVYDVGGSIRRAPRRSLGHHLAALAKNVWKPLLANAVPLGVFGPWAYLAWLVAYLTTFSLVIRVRSLAEHACMARGPDELRNTRTTSAGVLARAVFAPFHVNLHLEHHMLPTVPWYRLPALSRMLTERDVIPPASRARGYVDVLRQVSTS